MRRALHYIRFVFKCIYLHGIHSPFVFQLQKKVFKDRLVHEAYRDLHHYRQQLHQNKTLLNLSDFGAGSRKQLRSTRTVRQILNTSASSFSNAKLLWRLARHFKPKHILELGTNLGIGTQALALGHPKAEVTSIEACPELYAFTQNLLQTQGLNRVHLMNNTFDAALENLGNQSWDMIFIDGHHDKTATLNYFNRLLPHTHHGTIMICDDIYWSKGMTEAWQEIKAHPKVTATIDTFWWGIVFFRTEQQKEHFYIRV